MLLHHLDKIYVRLHLAIILLSYLHDRFNSKLGETILRTEDTFCVEGGHGDLLEPHLVVRLDCDSDFL